MKEHAEFIRGLLDPSEHNLILTADKYADEYKKIIRKIENLYVKELREKYENLSNITVEDVYIRCFYGVYRNSYVVLLDYGHATTEVSPADMEIDGVVFHFGHYRYINSLVVYQVN